jgi:hypothetical protein
MTFFKKPEKDFKFERYQTLLFVMQLLVADE